MPLATELLLCFALAAFTALEVVESLGYRAFPDVRWLKWLYYTLVHTYILLLLVLCMIHSNVVGIVVLENLVCIKIINVVLCVSEEVLTMDF